MPCDWRSLLSSLSIEWRDRGKNTSRNNITTNCPWCGSADMSGHLKIAEHIDAFHCLRDARHSGTNVIRLLTALGVPRIQANKLYNSHLVTGPHADAARIPPEPRDSVKSWHRFQNAAANRTAVNYLDGRGWLDPVSSIQRYDIRYAPAGTWAARILMPVPIYSDVEGWTGRAMFGHMEPKYLTSDTATEGMIYAPRPCRDTLFIVEGPLDALKLACATEDDSVAAVAILGKHVNVEKLGRIRGQAKVAQRIAVSLDSDTAIGEAYTVLREIEQAVPWCTVSRAPLPRPYKDAGEMPMHELRTWAATVKF
jgi:hypothetical protein